MEVSGEELLRDVIARPDDDGPRIVYADWLTQRGDPRGEFIVVQCALASKKGATIALVEREQALLDAHRSEWTKEAMQVARTCELRRGFVASIFAYAEKFASDGARLLDREPVDDLVLGELATIPVLDRLAATPHVARLRAVRMSARYSPPRQAFERVGGPIVDAQMLPRLLAFVRSPHVRRLRELEMQLTLQGVRATELLSVQWPKLRLKLEINGINADELRLLQRAMRWATISALA